MRVYILLKLISIRVFALLVCSMSASKLDVYVARQLLNETAMRTDGIACAIRNHMRGYGGAWVGANCGLRDVPYDECVVKFAQLSMLGDSLNKAINKYPGVMDLVELEEGVNEYISLLDPLPPVPADAECVMCKKKAFGRADNGLLECDECDVDGLHGYDLDSARLSQAKHINATLKAEIETLKAEGAQLRALIALSGEEKKTCAPSEEPKKKLWGDDPEVNDEVVADAALQCPDLAIVALEPQATCSAL